MPEVEFVNVSLPHLAAETELVLAHVVRHDVGQHAGNVVAPGRISDSHLFKPANRNARRPENGLTVNERVLTGEQAHGVHIEAVIGIIKRLVEIIHTKQNLVGNPRSQNGIQDRGVVLKVNRCLLEVILKIGTGRGQCETCTERRNLAALPVKRTEHQVMLLAEVMVQFEIAVVTVAD